VISVRPQPFAPAPLVFPPKPTGRPSAGPEKLAVSPDGSTLLVALNLAASAVVVNLNNNDRVSHVPQGNGSYPFGAAILPNGRTGLITNEGTGRVSVINLQSATRLATIHVGAALSHPAAVVVNTSGTRAYVALSNSDQVAVVNLSTRHGRTSETSSNLTILWHCAVARAPTAGPATTGSAPSTR
jgi:DNA-binding beta-propeller fold protein YncE